MTPNSPPDVDLHIYIDGAFVRAVRLKSEALAAAQLADNADAPDAPADSVACEYVTAILPAGDRVQVDVELRRGLPETGDESTIVDCFAVGGEARLDGTRMSC